jgi:molecular chaperone GrpE
MEENLQSAVADNDDAETGQGEPAAADSASALAAERDQLLQDKTELQDRMLRLQAEFDNFRKRTERERMEFAEYAGEQTVRALLPILDDLERALRAAPEDAQDEFVKGVELIYTRLLDTLKRQGLETIETAGEKFDPHQHEAIQRVHSDEHEDGSIVQEYQRGYNFKGKLLRPSMVVVSVKP